MFIPEGPGISVDDVAKIQQEMREWEAAESEVIAAATKIVLDHQRLLSRHGLIPDPPRQP